MAAPAFQAIGAITGATNATAAPALPAHVAGDIICIVVESANENLGAVTPAGYAEAIAPVGTGTVAGTTSTRASLWWKRATSNAEVIPSLGDYGDHTIAQVFTVRGAKSSGSPINAIAGSVAAAASATATFPAVITTAAECLIVGILTWPTDSASAVMGAVSNVNLAGITERTDGGNISGNGGGIAIWSGTKAAAGDTATSTATITSSVQARIAVAFEPEVSTPGNASGVIGTATATPAEAAANGAGTASAALVTVTASAPSGAASGAATAAGSIGTGAVTPPEASAGVPGFAAGSIGTAQASAPAATASGAGAAAGEVPTVTSTAPAGFAFVSSPGVADGPIGVAVASPPQAIALIPATASGALPEAIATAPEANATGGGAGLASGAIPAVATSAPTATATGGALGVGDLGASAATPPESSASGGGNAAGALSNVIAFPPQGSGSVVTIGAPILPEARQFGADQRAPFRADYGTKDNRFTGRTRRTFK